MGRILDSRRIAVYTDSRGRTSELYVVKAVLSVGETSRKGRQLCHFLVQGEGGGGVCSPSFLFLDERRQVAAGSSRLFFGVAANAVDRVVLVGSLGTRHRVKVTQDGGFIYNCRAYNGCGNLIACVEAYDVNGKLLSKEAWTPNGCSPGTRR